MKIFDAHGDYLYDFHKKKMEGESEIFKKHHLNKLTAGNIQGGIFILWQPVNVPFMEMLQKAEEELASSKDVIEVITTREQMEKFETNKKIAIIKGIEGLQVMNDDVITIKELYDLGYREMSLAWNEQNNLATGVRGDVNRGLTDLGRKAIKEMEDLGILLDVSHLNEKSFWDVVQVAKKPFIASHSNARALCDHPRNLTDEQLKAVAKANGIVGINAYRGFVSLVEEEKTVERLCDHIDYMVKLIGINHVGLGFDFCDYLDSSGPQNPIGMDDASQAQNLIKELEKRKYTQEEIEHIAYKNFKRIFMEIL